MRSDRRQCRCQKQILGSETGYGLGMISSCLVFEKVLQRFWDLGMGSDLRGGCRGFGL